MLLLSAAHPPGRVSAGVQPLKRGTMRETVPLRQSLTAVGLAVNRTAQVFRGVTGSRERQGAANLERGQIEQVGSDPMEKLFRLTVPSFTVAPGPPAVNGSRDR